MEKKKLEKILAKSTSEKQLYHTKLTILIDELKSTKKRAKVFLGGPIEEKNAMFYEGQMALISRLEDSIDTKI